MPAKNRSRFLPFNSRPRDRRRERTRLRLESLEERRLLAVCDFNDDGETGRTDFAIMAAHFGSRQATFEQGDCSGDGEITLLDVGLFHRAQGRGNIADWGDAPDRPYPTLRKNGGAAHIVRPNMFLGTAIDVDANGQPTIGADGDDNDADGDDEDGVAVLTPAVAGVSQRIRVDASQPGRLDAFVDFNRDGDWTDAGEKIYASAPLVAGANFLSHMVPAGALTDATQPTYARFRYSTAGGLTPKGVARDGEVEDYQWFVYSANELPPPTRHTTVWDAQAELRMMGCQPGGAGQTCMVGAEASGPAEFLIGPAIDPDSGMAVALGGPDTSERLPDGSWHIPIELCTMSLRGATFMSIQGVSIPGDDIEVREYPNVASVCPSDPSLNMGSLGLIVEDGIIQFSRLQAMVQIEVHDSVNVYFNPKEISVDKSVPWQNRVPTPPTFDVIFDEATSFDYMEPPPVDFEPVNAPGTVAFQLTRLVVGIPRRLDWGDAPQPPYPTVAPAGAAHVIRPGYSMGPTVDSEANGQPSPLATRDDTSGVPDDEDGVVLTSPINPGAAATVDVTAVGGKGYLNAWADFNRNGVWEAAEQIFTDVLLNVGVNPLGFVVPATTLPDAATLPPVISRWRFSRQKSLPTTGLSSSGEVEDHLLRVGQQHAVEVDHFPSATATMTLRFPDGSTMDLDFAGMTTVHVMFEGPQEGDAMDDDGDGLDEVMAAVVDLEMTAETPLGVFTAHEGASGQAGVIEESANQMAGKLDVPPFGNGTANSFFDVFLEVDVPIGPALRRFRTAGPVRLQGLVSQKPPAPGEVLCMPQGVQPVMLLDENGNPTGIHIVDACHTPTPRPFVEVDNFPNVLTQMEVNIPGRPPQMVSLTGETTVNVYFEGPVEGDADDDDGDGRDEVQSEIVAMEMRGFYSLPETNDEVLVIVRQSPMRRSMGAIEELTIVHEGFLDVPPFADDGLADSFFDVFVEVEIPALGMRLHNLQPARMQGQIHHKPPAAGDRYEKQGQPTPLFDPQGNATGVTIGRTVQIPNPAVERDFFRTATAEVELIDPQGNRHTVQLAGETTVEVYFEGMIEGSAFDDDGDGLDDVAARIVELDMTGTMANNVTLTLGLAHGAAMMGWIEEFFNEKHMRMDVPPFGPPGGLADSFFDVFFDMTVQIPGQGAQVWHSERSKHMQGRISHKPPAPGEMYQNDDVIRLLDDQNRPTGWSIGKTKHTPRPVRDIIPGEARSPEVKVNQSDNQKLMGEVNIPMPTQVPVRAGGDEWTQLLMPGAEALIGEVGMPAIPVIRRLVAIPMGAQAQVSCQATPGQTLMGMNLLPHQHTAMDGDTTEPPPPREIFDDPPGFSKNEAFYMQDVFIPVDPCFFQSLGKMRDLEIGVLNIYTAQYNPARQVLQTFQKIEYNINYVGGTGNFLPHQATNPFENVQPQYNGVLNAGVIYDYIDDIAFNHPCTFGLSEGSELIILTHPDFRDAADDLADWKRDKGITTSIFEVGTGTSRDTKEEIYDLLKQLWDECEVRPSYALLLGDAEFIPVWYRSTHYAGGDGGPASKQNQDVNSGQWRSLGTYYMNDDGAEYVKLVRPERDEDEPDPGATIADAVKFVRLSDNNSTIVDNQDAGFSTTGSWGESNATDEYDGSSKYSFEDEATATFTPSLPGEGLYEVFAWWSAASSGGGTYDRDSTATYYIYCDCTGTDTPYAYLHDGLNILPDIAIARMPVDTLTQAQTVVDKSINYEQNPPGGFFNPFYENASVASQFQGYRDDDPSGRDERAFVEVSEEARDTLMGYGKTVERIYGLTEDDSGQDPPEKYYDGSLLPAALRGGFPWDGDTNDVINAFNDPDGRFLITHRDHGSRGGWGTPSFGTGNVSSLSNGELLPVVYSVNCASGWFDNETSGMGAGVGTTYFSEALLREADGGAVGIIGDTRNSNTWSNTAFYRGLIDATWTDHDPSEGGGTSIRRLADIMNYAKEYTLLQIGVAGSTPAVDIEFAVDTLYLYHTFGDPTLEMWTGNPNNFHLPNDLFFEVPDPRHLEISYATPGAKVTAYQVIDDEIVPLTRGTVANDMGDLLLETIADINPQVPIQFAVCRDDAICIRPVAIPRRDFGDAPDAPYPTLIASGGAQHRIRPGFYLGGSVDAEANGQPSPGATRDDTTGIPDDEDGVAFPAVMTVGANATMTITASAPGILNGWIDYNQNGVWQPGAEQVFVNVPLVAGANVLTRTIPAGTTPGLTFARFRFASGAGLSPGGPLPSGALPDGEVEDYQVRINPTTQQQLDFGDLPVAYGTVLPIGPRHVVGNLFLGASVDAEDDGQPSAGATRDDTTGVPDDEDGVVPVGQIVRGATATLKVTASMNGLLQGWADFNNNTVWAATEQIFVNQPVMPGDNTLSFNVPQNALTGPTYFRFRLSTSAGLGPVGVLPTGGNPNGEVEDYQFDVVPGVGIPSPGAPEERRLAAIDAAYAEGKVLALDPARASKAEIDRGTMLIADRDRSVNRSPLILRARRAPRPRIDDVI